MPFAKGNTLSPGKGRPPIGKSITERIRMQLRRPNLSDAQQRAYVECMVDVLITAAIQGDMSAIKEILDRTEGKAPQSLTVSGDQEKPFRFIIQRITEVALEANNDTDR